MAWCWGFGWGDDAIDAKTRSMMNLAMIGALGKMHEWELHCRGALNNGVSREEIRAIIHVVGIYCGVPQALECFRAARNVLDSEDANARTIEGKPVISARRWCSTSALATAAGLVFHSREDSRQGERS